jgi:hypothetical protein
VSVVDLLEAVDVEEQRGHRHVQATRAAEDLFGAVEREDPVRELGKRVVKRPVLELAGALADEHPRSLARAGQHTV